MDYKIALIPGDGIGPEIVREAKKVLEQGMREIWTQLFLFRSSVRRRIHRCTRRTPY